MRPSKDLQWLFAAGHGRIALRSHDALQILDRWNQVFSIRNPKSAIRNPQSAIEKGCFPAKS